MLEQLLSFAAFREKFRRRHPEVKIHRKGYDGPWIADTPAGRTVGRDPDELMKKLEADYEPDG